LRNGHLASEAVLRSAGTRAKFLHYQRRSIMKHSRYVVLALAFSISASGLYLYSRVRAQSQPAIHPVAITYNRLIYSPSFPSKPLVSMTEILGVRADGSTSMARLVQSPSSEATSYNLKIADTLSGDYTLVDQIAHAKTTYPKAGIANQYLVRAASSCPGSPSQVISNYATYVEDKQVSTPESSKLPAIRLRSWRAPALNCLPLREEHWRAVESGKESLTMVLSASLVVVGEPAGWMFAIPADYVEKSPSELLSESVRLRGTVAPPLPDQIKQAYSDVNQIPQN